MSFEEEEEFIPLWDSWDAANRIINDPTKSEIDRAMAKMAAGLILDLLGPSGWPLK